jgi:hypothetical protein
MATAIRSEARHVDVKEVNVPALDRWDLLAQARVGRARRIGRAPLGTRGASATVSSDVRSSPAIRRRDGSSPSATLKS